jgi:2-dehydropantoate 2-reductase
MFGTGGIGTTYGYALSQSGVDVTHYVRPGKKAALRQGIAMRLLDGRTQRKLETTSIYQPKVVETLAPDDGYDFYIVSVRHYQIEAVLPVIKDKLGPAEVLFFNGNWAGFGAIEQALPAGKYLWGFPVASGGFSPDGGLNAALLDEVRLGETDGRPTPRLARLRAMFERAQLKVEIVPNIQHWLWVHFAINSAMIGAALKAGGAPELLKSLPRLHDAILAGREALAVCAARGVAVAAFADTKAFSQPAWLGAAAVWLMMRTNKPARKIMETHTAVDELQAIYRDVLTTGAQLGTGMPHFRALQPYVETPRRRSQAAYPSAAPQSRTGSAA